MKLTVKVEKRDKVRAFVRDFEDYGCINRPFDTEDFVELENAVILSVEEAKRISMFFGAVDCCSSDVKLTEGEKSLWQILNGRIEQAEKKDGH